MRMARRVRQAVSIKNTFQQLLFAGEFEEARRIADAELAKEDEKKKPKPKPAKPPKESRPAGEVIQFPIWPESQRALPNVLIRSALFSAAKRRRQVKRELLAAWGDTKILLTGETLNQADEDVWLQLVHLYLKQSEPADFKIRFNAKPFMREIGTKATGGSMVNRLTDSLSRLGGTVHVRHKRMEYGGGLVDDFTLDEDTGRFVVRLNPKFLQLFGTGHTRIDWKDRKALPRGLATWLHREVMSHRATAKHPHRDSVNSLHKRSGAGGVLKKFRHNLRRAMGQLEACGIVAFWSITANDALEYVRPS
jgi:hypothetical protein